MKLRLGFCFGVLYSSLWNFNSLFFKAVSYSDFVSSKIFSLDQVLFNYFLIDIVMQLMTWGEWLEDMLTYNKGPLVFLNGQYVPFVRLKVTSKKSRIFRFILISTLNPTFLKIFIIYFLIPWHVIISNQHRGISQSCFYQ